MLKNHSRTRTPTKIPAEWRSSQVVMPQNLLRARPVGRGIAGKSLDLGSWSEFENQDTHDSSKASIPSFRFLLGRL